ncbi:MAG: cupin domain-containing protein [Mesorhizobium sp.]|uniref:(R)-mandelonitrile lyase n=1 Tax=unclassified Mesorhizobium TaxID=325217 RepID=UPI000F752B46|nr:MULTISPECIES: cupin domain-containing protein [unclassified Mesorhizobium]AZO51439.1 cupin domain-containing protein [Mesorhizobium sp. M4B.F.Ca.ET.058.02.1.1]RUX44931.1 cupin domain-containing protein [Mesorhizobium sp. M4A.F.Ca.ET.050.02.1.1]RVC45613.1 cupin domain-containing protein [Mesorhizobium sp. M4A.F.Ca.ET.090.04.2.1]RVC75600.1 cupin domain-containing protein [Mesorhizobium sp. M4A.F.Ca.ET.022.05.2.1]RVD34087.1 cupin domain-containing protein [Mesorhizobium sp. M4A.F.Ca.ET.020.02.
MKIIACGSVPTIMAPEKYFTGRVLQTPIIEKEAPARLRATLVSFEPGARTNWHTHPLGQTLYVTSGAGRAQTWGGSIQEIKAGDVISFAPDEKHWHGAGASTAMTHIAMQEAIDGVHADWLEKVSDEQYGG